MRLRFPGNPTRLWWLACGLNKAEPSQAARSLAGCPSSAARTRLGQSGHARAFARRRVADGSTRSPSRVVWLSGRQRGRLVVSEPTGAVACTDAPRAAGWFRRHRAPCPRAHAFPGLLRLWLGRSCAAPALHCSRMLVFCTISMYPSYHRHIKFQVHAATTTSKRAAGEDRLDGRRELLDDRRQRGFPP